MLLAFAFWVFIGEEVTPGALLAAALALPAAFALTLDFAFTLALAFALGAAVSKNLSQLMGQLLLEKPVLQILMLVQVEAKASIASGGQASSWGYQQGRQVTSNFNLEHQCATWMVHALVHLTYFATFHQEVAQIPRTLRMYQPTMVLFIIHKRCCMRFSYFWMVICFCEMNICPMHAIMENNT